MNHLRFRQIHLDFHTPESIPGIGSEFDPDKFVGTLKAAAVDSITCFSRCHHGYIYHETRFPYRHPQLTCNLLEEQIRACHKADIKVPIYVTVGWDHLMATLHPEWVEVDETGKMVGRTPLTNGWGWYNMDFASPYVDFVIDQTQEVCDIFGDEVDGFFFDIIFQRGVHSTYCMQRFAQLGWDPADVLRQKAMRELLTNELTDRLYGAVREKNKNCTVFFNGGHIGPAFRSRLQNYSHMELESLPTGGWGYMHFPITSRYARTFGKEFLSMTGKFSETWGHFNSYKNEAALEYECFQALAQGGKCSIGDQLHPVGKLDRATYDLIGAVYRQVAEVEPWCLGAESVTEIAVINAEEFDQTSERMDPRNLSAARMLIEGRHQFDFIDSHSDWSSYKLVILPDSIPMTPDLEAKGIAFIASGGSMMLSHKSGLYLDGTVSNLLGQVIQSVDGDLQYSPDFMRPNVDLHHDRETDFVMYERGLNVTPQSGSETLATISEPYFNRTWEHFISHAHSPVKNQTDQPAVVQKGNIIYFAHPIFTTYAKHSMTFHREVVLNAIRRLIGQPLVELAGPTSLQATLTRQGEGHVLHLLHYIPEKRGLNFEIVENRLPVLETEVEVRIRASSAQTVPDLKSLVLVETEQGVRFTLPAFSGHQMVYLS